MIDKISILRLGELHPYLRQKSIDDFTEASNLLPSNYLLRITQGLRTIEYQNELYEQGRTKLFDKNGKRLGIVTNARGGESYHNYGLAFDLCILRDLDNNGTFETVDWNEKEQTKKVVQLLKARGWEWGGDFKSFKDYPHFQKSFGYKPSQLYAKYQTGTNFIEGTKYIQL